MHHAAGNGRVVRRRAVEAIRLQPRAPHPGVHYQAVVQGDVLQHDGEKYENTETCWRYISDASKSARYLGLVPAEAFVDRRNPSARVSVEPRDQIENPTPFLTEIPEWTLPSIPHDFAETISYGLPHAHVDGYGYHSADQPFHLELWIEKTSMDDVLIPLCEELSINLVRGAGLKHHRRRRVAAPGTASEEAGSCAVYLDFDPAGSHMPDAVARQLEFWRGQFYPGGDVKLNPLVMTREQADQFDLPRVPIKDEDRRKSNFEALHGPGCVELDALEALRPGEFERSHSEGGCAYRDESLRRRLREAESDGCRTARQEWDDQIRPQREELDRVAERISVIAAAYEDRARELNEQLQAELSPHIEQLDSIRHAVQEAADDFRVAIPVRPEPEVAGADEAHGCSIRSVNTWSSWTCTRNGIRRRRKRWPLIEPMENSVLKSKMKSPHSSARPPSSPWPTADFANLILPDSGRIRQID